ncbi:MAG: hypothetical protein OQJ84_04100 [Xanthomonadales bacterium]|nr:hypothetical protein [Xanthomonadales bacterium]
MKRYRSKTTLRDSKPLWCTILLALTSPLHAADILPLTRDCEIALALSAGPASLQESAGVFVLGEEGYELARESGNGYHCLVERNHPESIIPQCFDASSRNGNVQIILDEGALLRAGASFDELADYRTEALATDRYPLPGYGVIYMISAFNYIANPGGLVHVAPHVMFHAPYLTNEDIGSDRGEVLENRGLPMINSEGRHGVMVSFVDHGSDSSLVAEQCAGQLPDEGGMVAFPP